MAPKGGIVEGRAKPKSLLPSPKQAVKLKREDSSHTIGGDRITLPPDTLEADARLTAAGQARLPQQQAL